MSLNGLEIAVIGMAGRFPGANNINEYWDNICQAREGIASFTKEEMLADGADIAAIDHPNYVNAGGVLNDADKFDADFFNYSPHEAKILNPQHRVFIECAYEALENAAYASSQYAGVIGVFGSSSSNLYLYEHLLANPDILSDFGVFQLTIANSKDQLSTRVSHALNLTGPSINIQTACSSSLVAVHIACQSLLNGECTMALAGAVSIQAKQKLGYLYQEGMILSPDGQCRAFDARAGGTVGGNGVGVVVLKRYEDAIADGDRIDAIIKSSAVNNDGNLKVGFTAPSVQKQADVIAEAINMAGITADLIGYVEAHGTGTKLGDPIEIAGLSTAFAHTTHQKEFCAIGSVKTNIGHLDVAAGIAGLIKTILALKHKMLPASLHFNTPNPNIQFENTPFFVNKTTRSWDCQHIRRAGISAFGIGGTNAHLILEEAPYSPSPVAKKQDYLLFLSAKSPRALDKKEQDLIAYLAANPSLNPRDVAYSLLIGREAYAYKKALLFPVSGAVEWSNDRVFSGKALDRNQVAFLFPGQGAQHVNMGHELYLNQPTYRYWVDECAKRVASHLSVNIIDLIYPTHPYETEDLHQTLYAQPALFITEYALARMWMSFGIEPHIMIGHSLGEYVAACLSGVFTLDDALYIVCARAKLMQSLPIGKMLAVFLSHSDVQPLLDERIAVAAINTDELCVISGESHDLELLQTQLTEKKILSQWLQTSHAFHSPMMEPMLGDFKRILQSISFRSPNIPFVSNVTGEIIKPYEAINPDYWIKHLRHTVHFNQGIRCLAQHADVLLEVGPGRTLTTLGKRCLKDGVWIQSLPSIQRAVGQLWVNGIDLKELESLTEEGGCRRVALPTYPFERTRHWVNASQSQSIQDKSVDVTQSEEKAVMESPLTNVEHTLMTIWTSVLGVDNIDISHEFSMLGGHSLLAVQLVMKINATFNQNFAVVWVSENKTIQQQSASLLATDSVIKAYRPIIQFDKRKTGIPLFFIHPGHAGAEVYSDLASLLSQDYSFFAIESYNLYSGQPLANSIQALARIYLRHIQAISPTGPYYLGGWSLGGTIAYEIAQCLTRMGETVVNVWMIDSFVFNDETQLSLERLDHLFYRLEDEPSFQQLPAEYQAKISYIYALELRMLKQYRADAYAGPITLFNAKKATHTKLDMTIEESALFTKLKHKNGWMNHVTQIEEILVDEDHYSIMQESGRSIIADNINTY